MNVSFLIRLLPAACAVVVASPTFAQAAPTPAPTSRPAPRAAAYPAQDPQPAPAARAESADRVQTRLAEVMSMLEEEQMSAEMQQKALAKLTEVMERLKKERAAGQNQASPRMAVMGLGGVARTAPVPAPPPTPETPPMPRNDKAADAEAMGVPMPPRAAKAPKPPKAPKAPKAPDSSGRPAGENPFGGVWEHEAKAHEEAVKAHEEAAKAHDEALRAHQDAQAQRFYRVGVEAEEGQKRELGLMRMRTTQAKAAEDAAREQTEKTYGRSPDGKLWEQRAPAAQPQMSRTPTRARLDRETEGGDEDAEIRATIESMRTELREIRTLLKQLGQRAHDPNHGASGEGREVEARENDEPVRAVRPAR